MIFHRAHAFVDGMAGWPLVGGMVRRRYDRTFADKRGSNLFRGVFATFDEAQASAPATRPIGYDNPDAASMYVERTRKTFPTDYPVLFWLQRLMGEGRRRVFDLGGHIGVSYYAYRRYLDYPPGFSWQVHDVPAVMAEGRRFAAQKDTHRQLSFADDFGAAKDAEIVLAIGSLQYLPDTLAERIARLPSRPPHVIVNLMPLHERESYFTLQSIGTAFCPYRITATTEFLAGFDGLGYAMVDSWENPDKHCEIPFHPGHSLERYFGFHFRLTP